MKELTPEERAEYRAWLREARKRDDELREIIERDLARWRAEIERRRDARRLFGFIWTR
jgi:hypothetical protein